VRLEAGIENDPGRQRNPGSRNCVGFLGFVRNKVYVLIFVLGATGNRQPNG
jgi:hypothetical protein